MVFTTFKYLMVIINIVKVEVYLQTEQKEIDMITSVH